MSDRAMEIAQEHLHLMNPTMWDGQGERPAAFNPIINTYSIDEDTELDISFEKDDDEGWMHLCELRAKVSEDLLEVLSGYGIDSPQNLADTVSDICKGYL